MLRKIVISVFWRLVVSATIAESLLLVVPLVGRAPNSSRAADLIFLSPEEYAAISDSQTISKGFFDHNLANHIEKFGVMAHVYSTYESRFDGESTKPVARGIKSFEL
jgi:hypothetical protein